MNCSQISKKATAYPLGARSQGLSLTLDVQMCRIGAALSAESRLKLVQELNKELL
jgi:hypothetical protein